jgi:carbon monoxide dehydrogenase subunit G
MTRSIEVEITIPAQIQDVWDDLADVASHAEWMADAKRIDLVGERRSGAGTRMRVLTRLGPISVADEMEFVEWSPPTHMAIRHRGLVTGEGSFHLSAAGEVTQFTWRETLDFPWRLGGVFGESIAAPIFRAVWRRNLTRLRARFADPITGR